MYTVNKEIQQNYDIYPLHNNLNSLKGNSPTRFDYSNTTNLDRDRTFDFNDKINRYAYVADGSRLEYNYSASADGTVFLRAYSEETLSEQYLFAGYSSTEKRFGLYLDSNSVLWLNFLGTDVSTGMTFEKGKWHSVGMSFQFQGYQFAVTVFLDENKFSKGIIQSSTLSCSKLVVGHSGNDVFQSPFCGQIEMLATSGYSKTQSQFNTLASEMQGVSKINEYDKIGRLSKVSVICKGKEITSRAVVYKTKENTTTVSSYILGYDQYGDKFRIYTTDKLGRVTQIKYPNDSEENVVHTYSYDFRGFLTSEDGETITYYTNGNIRKKGDTEFVYDSAMKDRLLSVGGKAVQYSDTNKFNPTSWNGRAYEYEGNRLVSFTKDGTTYKYVYNEKGQRIYKYSSLGATQYVYDGDRLIAEINNLYRLDFLYDENGMLFGIVKDNKMYFYVRDSLGNILELVDEEGNCEASYDYTAYGECKTDSTSTLSKQNPFRFKGYYYDTESGMYCIGNRFYVPEWCCWLTAEDPTNLNYTHPTCINLFVFCGNNPIGMVSHSNAGENLSGSETLNKSLSTSCVSNGITAESGQSNINSITMTHYTVSIFKNPGIAWFLGNISYTETFQLDQPAASYFFSNIGNDGYRVGFGMNWKNWAGSTGYYTSDIGFGSSWQLTPWVTGSSSWSLKDGISVSAGLILGDVTHEVTISIGNGILLGYAACSILATVPIPGMRALAGAAACMIFIIDLFN